MINTNKLKYGLLAVFMALIVATSMPAMAISGITVTISDNSEGATTDWTVNGDVESSGTISEIYIDSGDGGDLQSLSASNTNVSIGGTDQTLSDVSGDGTDAVSITLSSGTSVSGGETVSVDMGSVENQDQGDYTLTMEFSDGTSTFDTGTTDYTIGSPADAPDFTGTSELPGTISDYNASEDSQSSVEITAATDDVHLEVRDMNTSEVYAEYDTTHEGFQTVTEATDTSDGEYHWNLTDDDFTPVPLEVNETKDFEFVAVHNGSENINTLTIENGMEVSQIAVTSNAVDDDSVGPEVTHEDDRVQVLNRTLYGDESYEISDERTIDGSNTTVYLTVQDGNVSEEIGQTEVDSLLRTTTFESGDWMWSTQVQGATSDGDLRMSPTYLGTAGDLHPDGATYATYNQDRDQMVLHLGDRYEGESTMEVDASTDNVDFLDRLRVNRFGSESLVSDLEESGSWIPFMG